MFKNIIEFEEYLKKIIDRHHNSLSIVLNRLGIKEPITPGLLLAIHKAYGDQFYTVMSYLQDEQEHFDGRDFIIGGGINPDGMYTGGTDDVDEENDFWQKFKNTVTDGLAIIKTGTEIRRDLIGSNSSEGSQENTPEDPKKKDTILGIPKFIFWGATAVVTLLVVYIVVKSIKS